MKARVIAYYLPQFHPTEINNEWWGTGFTEWTNVGKAKPLFRGHYQPRVPADLGYYDLRLPEVREAQATMAKNAGIEGFMYWHYWFGNGKRALEMPLNEVLKSGEPKYPFCMGWANHSWSNHEWNSTTQWNKKKSLIEQEYPGDDDIKRHFYKVFESFKDERYITVEDKPLFLIYDPLKIPETKKFIDTWQNLARQNGLKGIHFVALSSQYKKEIFDAGYDAINLDGRWNAEAKIKGRYTRLVINKLLHYVGGLTLDRYKYEDIIKNIFSDYNFKDNVYPTIIPQWDRSARSGRRAVIYTGSTPEKFGKHVRDAIAYTSEKPEQNKIIFLKSWNEWAEGNYVEPDLVYGHGYLNTLKSELL